MKNSSNLRSLQEEYKATIVGLCCICQKPCRGWYGRWGDVGTCNSKCEKEKASQPKYPGHSEEDFFKRLEEHGEAFGPFDPLQGDSNGS